MVLIDDTEDGHDADFARIFEQMYDPAILFDPALGRIRTANKAAQSFLGYELSELTKLTPSDLHPHEIPRLEVFIKTVLEKKRWTSDELSCRTKSGDTVPAQIRATSVHVFGSNCILAIIHNRRTDKLAELGQAIRKVVHDVRSNLARALFDRLESGGGGFPRIVLSDSRCGLEKEASPDGEISFD